MIDEYKFDWSKFRILIAEDDMANYILLKYMLEESKVTVIRAKNGNEAVEICKSEDKIDLVLMDVKMPVMDGIEATSAIKTFRPDLPIIMQSAHILDEVRLNCIEAGCDDFFIKPFNEELFFQVIDSYLKK